MKSLVDYETRPMTSDESEFLMNLMMITTEIPMGEILALSMCNLINQRLPEGFEVDRKLLLLVGELAQGSPGNGVMWAFNI